MSCMQLCKYNMDKEIVASDALFKEFDDSALLTMISAKEKLLEKATCMLKTDLRSKQGFRCQ